MKPVVGITFHWYENSLATAPVYGRWCYGLNQAYADLVAGAGAVPLGIIPAGRDCHQILELVDMLLLTGGDDPAPELFGQVNRQPGPCMVERPLWEMELYMAARRMGKPVLGICFGMQLIAIAEGIPLIQDIGEEIIGALDHNGKASSQRKHPVEIAEGTMLYDILGACPPVSSYHHQAIAGVPNGFIRAAVSSDGVIEAIETPDASVVAVQWHPERDFTGTPIMQRRLSGLISGKIR